MTCHIYSAKVLKVIDGDTIDTDLDLGFRIHTNVRFRLNGIDTPELNQSDATLKLKAQQAKQFLEEQILGKDVVIMSHKTDKYGRWLADVSLVGFDCPTINDQLITLGLAKKYFGESRTTLWDN